MTQTAATSGNTTASTARRKTAEPTRWGKEQTLEALRLISFEKGDAPSRSTVMRMTGLTPDQVDHLIECMGDSECDARFALTLYMSAKQQS